MRGDKRDDNNDGQKPWGCTHTHTHTHVDLNNIYNCYFCYSSATMLCPILFNPMDCSTAGSPVLRRICSDSCSLSQ